MTEIKKELYINEIQETNIEKRKLEENLSDTQVNKKQCVANINDKTINNLQQNIEIKQEPNVPICRKDEKDSNNIHINNKGYLEENIKNYKYRSNDFQQNIEIKQEPDSQKNFQIQKEQCETLLQVQNDTATDQQNSCASNTETTEVANCSTNITEIKSEAPTLFNGKDITTLSKSQKKKYQKMLSWEANKKEKRQKEKLRAKMRKIELKKNNIYTGPSRKELKRRKMCHSPCKTSVIIDLSFDDLMIPKDLGKVVKQLLRVYTVNRRSETPMQLHLTSFEGKSKEEMKKNDGYEKWDCYFHPENYIDIFPKEKLIYLSSESDNVITELDQDKFYIIGGLVDHNAHKGLCYKKAVEQGIQHGQLPINDFFKLRTRKVFTINQVYEILLKVSEGLSFKEAFELVLPQRINLEEKESDGDKEEYEDDDDDEEI